MQWADLSDDQLRRALIDRGVPPNYAAWWTAHRSDDSFTGLITNAMGRSSTP
jgi:hypothetical protein